MYEYLKYTIHSYGDATDLKAILLPHYSPSVINLFFNTFWSSD